MVLSGEFDDINILFYSLQVQFTPLSIADWYVVQLMIFTLLYDEIHSKWYDFPTAGV
jgi:hypothetical protein